MPVYQFALCHFLINMYDINLHFRLSTRQNLHHWIIAGLILWHHKHNVNFGSLVLRL